MFKQSDQHPATYYAHSCRDQLREYAPLAGAQRYDVAVVGAGFSGLHTALRLAEAGKRVVLLEASRVAWAASGRNGGQAILGWSCDMPPLERTLGLERARRLWEGMRWAADEIRALPQRHGFDCDYRAGHLWTSVMPRRVAMLHEWQEHAAHKWGHDQLQLIPREQLGGWVAS
jgi:glycine/D-amino acid oxidase-like deaminating enzyme